MREMTLRLPHLLPAGTPALPCYAADAAVVQNTVHMRARVPSHLQPQLAPFLSAACRRAAGPLGALRSACVSVDGTHGCGLCVVGGCVVVSVEAAALFALLEARSDGLLPPVSAPSACSTVVARTANGWTGVVTGQALQWVLRDECESCVAPAVLHDRYARALAGAPRLDKLAWASEERGWRGAPDLLLWRGGELEAIEVKTTRDTLKPAQAAVLAEAGCRGVLLRLQE